MLNDEIYSRSKRKIRFWPGAQWARMIIVLLIGLLFIMGIIYSLQNDSSRRLVSMLLKQSFPFETIILEGAPGYSQPERLHLDQGRQQAMSLGMFLLTGVNIADSRTFFLSYFAPPPQGPAWLGWAYSPNDPEFEGPILEPIANNAPVVSNPPPSEEQTVPATVPPKNNQASDVLVGIYHTHNAESYTGDGGPEREDGENGDIVTVGETLKKSLEEKGIKTVHSLDIHDSADFMTSYSRSIKTANKLIQDSPSIRLLFDIHRDGIPKGVQKSTVTVNGKTISRILIVLGKQNPHWQKNEEVAKELIEIGEKKYPGLFFPNISYAEDARYNQHLSDGALLLEFGSQMNTLAEANGAAEAVADVIAEWLKT